MVFPLLWSSLASFKRMDSARWKESLMGNSDPHEKNKKTIDKNSCHMYNHTQEVTRIVVIMISEIVIMKNKVVIMSRKVVTSKILTKP